MNKIFTRAQLCSQLGINKHTFAGKLARGEITKLDRGKYVLGRPVPQEVARLFAQACPSWALTGISAYQHHTGAHLTFPLHYRGPRNTTQSRATRYFSVQATKRPVAVHYNGLWATPPVVAAWDARTQLSGNELTHFLEDAYSGKNGKHYLELHLSWMGRVPAGLRAIISTISIGSDSKLERRFFHALAKRGLSFKQNVLLGQYMWDFQSTANKRLLVEVGAHKYHRDLSTVRGELTYVRESWKFNQAALEGYVVMQFTAKCIDHELERCLDMVEDALATLEGADVSRVWEPPWHWHSWMRAINRVSR